jgi:hypothetical protein
MVRDPRFMLMNVEDIRNGIGKSSPGWVVGAFVKAGDLRHSEDFEIKEWDLRTMRRDWRNGEECGPEYIAVLDGTLIIVLGRAGEGNEIVEDRVVEVATNQRIILVPGVWRKLKGTDNIKGLTVRSKRT